jgi:hypothetical protein
MYSDTIDDDDNNTNKSKRSSCSSPVTTKNATATTVNELLCNTFKPFVTEKTYELVVDDDDHHRRPQHYSGCDSSALEDFMGRLLSSALLIVDSDDDDDGDDCCEEKFNDSDSASDASSTPSLQEDKELVIVHDNARLPYQMERRNIRIDRPERSYSERAETKRETRWSSLNGKNPRCAGLTLPSRTRTGSIDYSNLPMPSMVGGTRRTAKSSSSSSPTKPTIVVDTVPTYPRGRRRCSA